MTVTGTQFNDNDTWNGGAFRPSLRGTYDELYGGGGHDAFWGGGGHDELHGGGEDYLYGELGDDELYGGTGRDDLFGGSGHDELHGSKGNDYLVGGFGADDLSGGKGADRFIYNEIGQSNSSSTDTICDFSGAGRDGDKIELDAIDADVNWWAGGNQAFHPSRLSYDPVSGVLKADIYGTANDIEIEICGDFNVAMDVIL